MTWSKELFRAAPPMKGGSFIVLCFSLKWVCGALMACLPRVSLTYLSLICRPVIFNVKDAVAWTNCARFAGCKKAAEHSGK